MKRFSQTLKVMLALFVGIFSNGLIPAMTAYAYTAPTGPVEKVQICHASNSDTNPYVANEPNADAVGVGTGIGDHSAHTGPVWNPTLKDSKIDWGDIIPPFTDTNNRSFDGLNWDAAGQAIYSNNCNIPGASTHITPETPTASPLCGPNNDSVTLPQQTGVSYASTGWANGSLTVTATAASASYVLDGTTSWTFTDANEECAKVTICHRTASMTNPYVSISVDVSSVDGNTSSDKGQGDHYTEHTGPIFPLVGNDGKWGDIIPPVAEHGGRNWNEEGQAILRNDCNIPVKITVTPGACAYYDTKSTLLISVAGTAKDSDLVVYDAANKIVYTVAIVVDKDGEVTSPTFPVTVSGLAAGSYTVKVLRGETVLASETATIASCKYVVTPEKPTAVDSCYGDKDNISIESTKDVIYKVNGFKASGSVAYEGKALVVTAEAAPGYVLKEGATSTWTFSTSDFTNKQCLTITKTGKVANDTNHDGVIGVGDTVTWEITVTNTGESKYEKFYVTLEDTNVTLQNNGYIGYLGAGEHVTLTGTSVLTAKDFQVCKATNTATFFGWRANRSQDAASDSLSWVKSESKPLATASASAEYTLICPTPGSGNLLGEGATTTAAPVVATVAAVAAVAATTTETPEVLPATGPSETSNFFAMIFTMGIAYGATYFLQRRREVTA